MSETYDIRLSEEDLLSMDGKCPKAIQDVIDTVHVANQIKVAYGLAYGLEPHHAIVLSKWLEIIKMSEEEQKRIERYTTNSSYCSICKKHAGYETYKRGSYLHKKGSPNRDKPLNFLIVNLSCGNSERLHMCRDCYDKIKAVVDLIESMEKSE